MSYEPQKDADDEHRIGVHIALFFLATVTTFMAGSEFVTNKFWHCFIYERTGIVLFPYGDKICNPAITPDHNDFFQGWLYSLSFLTFLTFHEFGHYFMAVYHRVKCSLPYYIPIFLPFSIINIGSMGAVIRLRSQPDTTSKFFDIGIAGPLAGFVISLILLTVGFSTLPPLEDTVLKIHPEYLKIWGYVPSETEMLQKFGNENAPQMLYIGHSLLFTFFEQFVADPARLPNHFEIMHYPMLFVGFITLFFTALNLLPIGQLDGGHITYGLFGRKRAGIISRITVTVLVTMGGLGLFDFQRINWTNEGLFLLMYLVYLYLIAVKITGTGIHNLPKTVALIAGILILQQAMQSVTGIDRAYNLLWIIYGLVAARFIGLDHPPARVEEQLDLKRKILGYVAIVIFIICFTPAPLKFL